MRLVVISDTHNRHKRLEVPEGGVLVHAGDLTGRGELHELRVAAAWLNNLPHEHKIVIAGNHDFCLEDSTKRREAEAMLFGCTYLHDQSVTINGIKFYGSPYQPWFYDWAFNMKRGGPLQEKWAQIPADTDVLITHGPPFGFGDRTERGERVGCEDLAQAIARVQPRYHLFGHIHEDPGVWQPDGPTTFVNACVCDLGYNPIQSPVVLDIAEKETE